MANWINKTDIQNRIPQFSPNIEAVRIINQIIFESQQFDLEPFLGNPFYYELDSNVDADASPVYSENKYSLLFEGDTYTENSLTIYFTGLKDAVIYFAFARFLEDTNMFFTRGGAKFKNTDQSSGVSGKELAGYVNNYRSKAVKILNDARKYLIKNEDTFTNWRDYCKKHPQRKGIKSFVSGRSGSNVIYPPTFSDGRRYFDDQD